MYVYIILYYIILYYRILNYRILNYLILYYLILYYLILYYIILYIIYIRIFIRCAWATKDGPPIAHHPRPLISPKALIGFAMEVLLAVGLCH